MECGNITINSRKNKHLNDFKRGQIQLLRNKGYFAYKIAKWLNIALNTIINELKRGRVAHIKNNIDVEIYYPDTGKAGYVKNKKTLKNHIKLCNVAIF